MQKLCTCLFATLLLAACAGAPPSWWNPNNRYGTTQTDTSKKAQAPSNPASKTIVIKEETIDPLPDASYEEETLTPLPDANPEQTPASADENTLPAPSVLD